MVPRYDWLADAVLILRAAGTSFNWDRLTDTADRYCLGSILRLALKDLVQTLAIPIPAQAFPRRSRWRPIDRAEARWRRIDPSRVSAVGRCVFALQRLRRHDASLARRPAWAVMPEIWRSLRGLPPSALMRPTTADNCDDQIIFLDGWSAAEDSGRWTVGPKALLAIQRAQGRKGDSLRLVGHTIGPDKPQVIDVYNGWRRLARLSWPAGGTSVRSLQLPRALHEQELLMLQLRIRRPVRPHDISINEDTRPLGLFLEDIGSSPCVRDISRAPLDLRHGSRDLAVLWSGWSGPESEGCWTDGPDALLRWTSPRDLPTHARLVIRGFSFAPYGILPRGFISINNQRVTLADVLDRKSGRVQLSLPLRAAVSHREIAVHIHVANPRSPSSLGLSSDSRRLGLFVQSLCIELQPSFQ